MVFQVPLLLIISLRYLYLSVSSISMSPSFSSVWTLLAIFINSLFSFPNTMRYLLEISFVMSSIFCISWALLLIRTISSMYSRHPNLGCDVLFVFTPSSYLLISSDISSITVAYISTESTPPCLMLSLIFISLVLPYCVFIVAVRLVFMSYVICQFSVYIPLLFSTYSSAYSHALSYAFVTSRYTIYRGFFLFFCVAMLSLVLLGGLLLIFLLFLPLVLLIFVFVVECGCLLFVHILFLCCWILLFLFRLSIYISCLFLCIVGLLFHCAIRLVCFFSCVLCLVGLLVTVLCSCLPL